jgi:predicted DNA-binding protein (UPF0251 family)
MTEEHFKFIRLIKDRKITKKEIASRMSITLPTLNARLNNPRTLKLSEVEELNDILNTNILEII